MRSSTNSQITWSSLAFFSQHFFTFFLYQLLIAIPLIIIAGPISDAVLGIRAPLGASDLQKMLTDFQYEQIPLESILGLLRNNQSSASWEVSFMLEVIKFAGFVLWFGILVVLFNFYIDHKEPKFEQIFLILGQRFIGLLIVWVIFTVLTLVGSFFCLIPGLLATIYLFLWPVAVMLEDESSLWKAFDRTLALIKGHLGKATMVLTIATLPWVIAITFFIFLEILVFFGFYPALSNPSMRLLELILKHLVNMIVYPFMVGMLVLFYKDLRSKK